MKDDKEALEQVVLTRLMRLNATVQGIAIGVVLGLAVFVATNWLLLKGGPIGPEGEPLIGPHLWLLSQFLIGYEVTFLGSLIGFGYGFGIGFVIGYFIAISYNWLVDFKTAKKRQIQTHS